MDWGVPAVFSLAFAGLVGAWVFAVISPIRENVWRAAASISVGFGAALFISPVIWWLTALESLEARHAIAFTVGLIGNPLCRLALSEGPTIAWAWVKGAIARALGNSKNGNGGPPYQPMRPDSDPP